MDKQKGSNWAKYTREYRRRNPEKVKQWRINSARNLLKKNEQEQKNEKR